MYKYSWLKSELFTEMYKHANVISASFTYYTHINKNNRHDITKIFSGVKHPNTPITGNIETPSQNSISITYFMKLQTYK